MPQSVIFIAAVRSNGVCDAVSANFKGNLDTVYKMAYERPYEYEDDLYREYENEVADDKRHPCEYPDKDIYPELSYQNSRDKMSGLTVEEFNRDKRFKMKVKMKFLDDNIDDDRVKTMISISTNIVAVLKTMKRIMHVTYCSRNILNGANVKDTNWFIYSNYSSYGSYLEDVIHQSIPRSALEWITKEECNDRIRDMLETIVYAGKQTLAFLKTYQRSFNPATYNEQFDFWSNHYEHLKKIQQKFIWSRESYEIKEIRNAHRREMVTNHIENTTNTRIGKQAEDLIGDFVRGTGVKTRKKKKRIKSKKKKKKSKKNV